jgi:uncharacterized protein
MKTRIDLEKYRKIYDTFDCGHGWGHIVSVREFSLELGRKYCPDKLEIVWVAATLHDIGLCIGRDKHEEYGAEIIIKDESINSNYSKEEIEEIVHSVREHRASTGNPQTIVAKIVSDSDKVSDDTSSGFSRAYNWGVQNLPELNHEEQLLRAASHLEEKFGEGGTGTRLYFAESKERLYKTYKPIFKRYSNYDLQIMEGFLKSK